MSFELDARLASDSVLVGRLALCQVRWMCDARYPWALLVPERANVREIHELGDDDRRVLIDESARVASALSRIVSAHKMNVAAIGNVVSQLHVHVVARFATDDAWPRPVWGALPALPYEPAVLEQRVAALRTALEI